MQFDHDEQVSLYGTNWDEGLKRSYVFVRLADMATIPVPDQPAPWIGNEQYNNSYPIPDGVVCVVHVYSGVNQYIIIKGNASVVTPALPAPLELTPDESNVLNAICSVKSSYAGISNYRLHYCRSYVPSMTEQRWENAKQSLIAKKLLTKAGAVTPAGRNARPKDWVKPTPAIGVA